MGMKFALLVVTTLTIFAFSYRAEATIFGFDDREPITSLEYPWSAIGLLEVSNSEKDHYVSTCTATLISENLILTAGDQHCVDSINKNKIYYFYPFSSASTFTTDNSARATLVASGHRIDGGDWAVLQVPSHIGEKFGFIPIGKFDFISKLPFFSVNGIFTAKFFKSLKYNLPEYVVAGFDFESSYILKVHRNCPILGIDSILYKLKGQQQLKNYCDLIPGNSGGPMLMKLNNQWRLVGINSTQSMMGLRVGLGNPDRNWAPVDQNSTNTVIGIFPFFETINNIILKYKKN